jgi:hypothetical protein
MSGLRVLITNNTLNDRAGSELYVRDLATGLLERGHTPIAYSSALGAVAGELRRATVPVVSDLDAMGEPPDLIHGHHHVETMTALLRFPDVPAVFFCHGWIPWEEMPPHHPRILQYVAVDDTCRDRLVYENGIAADRVRVLLNFVDLHRFQPRPPLPSAPTRALVFSNYATEDGFLSAVRQACARAGIEVDALGAGVGNNCARPEDVLGRYDLVFAKSRAAMEAMATGAAVVLCDRVGAGGMVTAAEFERLRRLNFGIRCLVNPNSPEVLLREIGRYDPADATEVCRLIRTTAGREVVLDQVESLYREVLSIHAARPQTGRQVEARAAAAYLRSVSPVFQQTAQKHLWADCERLRAECDQLRQALGEEVTLRQQATLQRDQSRGESGRLQDECLGLRHERDELRTRRDLLEQEAEELRLRCDGLRSALDDVHRSATMRLRASLLRRPWLRSAGRLGIDGVQAVVWAVAQVGLSHADTDRFLAAIERNAPPDV